MSDMQKRRNRQTRPVHVADNPLVRPVDRAEARLHRTTLTVFLLIVPFAVVLGVFGYGQLARSADAAAVSLHTVEATTTADAPSATTTGADVTSGASSSLATPATWTLDGREHEGTVAMPPRTPAGATVSITVDAAGNRVAPPPSNADNVVAGAFLTVLVLAAAGVVLLTIRGAATRRYADLRDREWDEALARLFAEGR
ncbi:Rv1733c family protein [Rhodococcoides corynebacterioides]|uniref:Rv1733c family protein n=1 Tax=Rhodococcoides corynebacterioides TaxID=53972 RepID=UPI000832DD21|nr:hypothetical protein [Rhodococcus corynebacterioides]MBY6351611.1 hypothetical protein [Rhodococcus corynebacterioides]